MADTTRDCRDRRFDRVPVLRRALRASSQRADQSERYAVELGMLLLNGEEIAALDEALRPHLAL